VDNITWHFWQGENYAGHIKLPYNLTMDEAIARFEKRTGILADFAAGVL
jgi:hypothetical protein